MKLEVFEKYTRQRIGLIKKYNYVSYTIELVGDGTIEIQMPTIDDSVQYLIEGNYIWFEDDVVGIIKNIEENRDNDSQIIISGYLLNHLLTYRCFIKSRRLYETPGNAARTFFDELFMNPTDQRREISFLDMKEEDIHDLEKFSQKKTFQKTGDNLLEALHDMFKPYGLGFTIYPRMNTLYESNEIINNIDKMFFKVVTGIDRSVDNPDNNNPVVFSFDTNNLQSLHYSEDSRQYKNLAIVAGEGEGEERVVVEVGDDQLEGLDRIELYVDARDLQSGEETEDPLTPEEYEELLQERGEEKLGECEQFETLEASVIANSMFKYGIDYNIGDYVSIIDDKIGKRFDNVQITQVSKSISNGNEHFDITFGYDRLNMMEIKERQNV